MRSRRKRTEEPSPTADVADHRDKRSDVRPVFQEEDEWQTGEDRHAYHTPMKSIFEPVPLPKWLKPRKPKNWG
jgi:hypothetical protein